MKKNLLIILVYACIFFASETAYRIVFGIANNSADYLRVFAYTLALCAAFYFAKYTVSRVFIFLFFAIATIGNNIHYEVYKTWITAVNYYLFIVEFSEVREAGMDMLGRLAPHILWGAAECAVFFSMPFWNKNKNKKPVADILFLAAILISVLMAARAKDARSISPKAKYARIEANYLSFGGVFSKVLPIYLFGSSRIPAYRHPAPQKNGQPRVRNIVFLVGESESARHLSYFGYPRATTPRLSEFAQKHPDALISRAYSTGLMTRVALPMLFNAIPHPNGFMQISMGDTNLIRLAKEQGYTNYFYSAQAEGEMRLMNLLGIKWIDHLTYPSHFGFGVEESMPDKNLIKQLKEIDLSKGRNFIVLHQRASHMPYSKWLEPSEQVFGMATEADKYDNTIHQTDVIRDEILKYLEASGDQDWIFIYTSDHGQLVSDKEAAAGVWHEDIYTVPLMVYSPNNELQAKIKNTFSACEYNHHYQLSAWMIDLLGYDYPPADCLPAYVSGNMLTGDAGYMKIHPDKRQEMIAH